MVAQRCACALYIMHKIKMAHLFYVNVTSIKKNSKTVAQAQTRDKDPPCTQSLEKLPKFQGHRDMGPSESPPAGGHMLAEHLSRAESF